MARAVIQPPRLGRSDGAMIEKHGWKLFFVIGSFGTIASVGMLVDPAVGFGMLNGLGPAIPAGFTSDPFAAFLVRWIATTLLGGNVLTLAVAATAFRRGERWAGVAFLYWPAMFLSHLILYKVGPMSLVQLMWLSLTIPALVVHFRRTAAKKIEVATA
jgi:hypothetical protein